MIDRRKLLGLVSAGLAGTVALPGRLRATTQGEEMDWLTALAGKPCPAFLDIRSFATDGAPFRKAANLHRALTEAHDLPPADVGIAFGAGGSAIVYTFGRAIWEEYGVGARVGGAARDADELASLRGEPGRWADGHGEEIARMRAAGMHVLACRNSTWRWARDLAAVTGEAPERVNEKLLAGLHTGVEPVPAMIAAAVLAQRHGVAYVAIE